MVDALICDTHTVIVLFFTVDSLFLELCLIFVPIYWYSETLKQRFGVYLSKLKSKPFSLNSLFSSCILFVTVILFFLVFFHKYLWLFRMTFYFNLSLSYVNLINKLYHLLNKILASSCFTFAFLSDLLFRCVSVLCCIIH